FGPGSPAVGAPVLPVQAVLDHGTAARAVDEDAYDRPAAGRGVGAALPAHALPPHGTAARAVDEDAYDRPAPGRVVAAALDALDRDLRRPTFFRAGPLTGVRQGAGQDGEGRAGGGGGG